MTHLRPAHARLRDRVDSDRTQISLTMNTYAHVMPAVQREAAAQMDALLTASK